MFSNYRVGITCSDPTILQAFAILLQEPECKITEDNGEYFWSSTLFEGLPTGVEVARKANQYLPALNGLIKLYLPDAPIIIRTSKMLYDNGSGGTGMYWEQSVRLPISYSISEEENERRRQIWIGLIKSWANQEGELGILLTNALTHYGEEVLIIRVMEKQFAEFCERGQHRDLRASPTNGESALVPMSAA